MIALGEWGLYGSDEVVSDAEKTKKKKKKRERKKKKKNY
mgnify:CR=1 FL=1